MDVRCEKCQTEYELDESRLKPGGVTVKCTNCGHMFKIRKRTPTNVGAPVADRSRSPSNPLDEGPTTIERQWVIRLENGEQKTCRELATLQQWIVSNAVTREALISRTGKTWKRLGDIAELAQYFSIADEARAGRAEKSTQQRQKKGAAGTMLGVGATAAGGTILPDEDEERSTGSFRAPRKPTTQPPPLPPGSPDDRVRTPPMGSNVSTGPVTPTGPTGAPRRPLTQPPGPPPGKKTPTGPVALAQTAAAMPSSPKPTPAPPMPDARSTAAWASDPIKATGIAPSGPYVGKLAAIPDEPAFAGRVRVSPSDESSFDTGKVRLEDDEDDFAPRRSGSKAGLIILVMTLLVGAGAAAVVYLVVIKKDKDKTEQVATPSDAAPAGPDATLVVTPMIDAAEAAPPSPIEIARGELGQNIETRLRAALETLPKDAPETQAVRANLYAAIAQSLLDRSVFADDKAGADKLRKEAKAIVLDAAAAAQRAQKATPDDTAANIAMANVLRLQGKTAKDMQRYVDAAKSKPGDWARDAMLAEALVLARDMKLDDARKALEAIDAGPNKLETSNDVRARFHLALIAYAQNRFPDAKTAVDSILAAQPEHLAAKAMAAKLETKVSHTDPLPPEDPKGSGGYKPPPSGSGTTPPPDTGGGGSYDQLLARANKLAETSCAKAIELYAKALEQKPNGVEALTGQGYCHIDAKQFASAFSKFRSALAISSKYEPALWGVAEAYQQQGRREQAIEAYKKYLEVYPGTPKAQKQLDRLQGQGPGSAPPPPDGSATPPKDPPEDPPPADPQPTPSPVPTPTPVPVGSGS